MRWSPVAPLTVVCLYVFFSLTSAFMGLWGVVYTIFTFDTTRISHIGEAMDRLLAAGAGYDGRSTISKECGQADACRLCRVLCWVLNYLLAKNHCRDTAS